MTDASQFSVGTVLAGKYRVERVIGQGGMGVVVEARHITLDERVALKFLLPEFAAHPEAPGRFLREARAAVKIKSAHVARVSDVGTLESGAPYMVMEYLEGSDASRLIEGGRVLSVADAVDLIVQACDAISSAHAQGIVHRDLKPANLFVARHSDGSAFVKVLDFGISKIVDQGAADALTRTNATMGSALYMSPEQIRQSRSVDRRTDIYALGITLYEFLTARHPFNADSFPALCVEIATGTPTSVRQHRPDIPPELAAVIEKASARDLSARYQNIAELVVALGPWVPARSRPIFERIARSGGLLAPEPGAETAPSAASASGAAGAVSASTQINASTTVPGLPPSGRSRVAAGAIVVLALGAGGVLLLRRGSAPADMSHPATAEPVHSAPPPTLPAAAPSPEVAQEPAPRPAETTTISPALPSATPAPSSTSVGTATEKPGAPAVAGGKHPGKTPGLVRPAAPAAPAKPKGADEYR